MFFYSYKNKILISNQPSIHFKEVSEDHAKNSLDTLYLLHSLNPKKSRRRFSVTDPSLAFLQEEGIQLLQQPTETEHGLPHWLTSKIMEGKVTAINTAYPNWQKALDYIHPKKWRIHVVGLGDVGGILVTGLRLLGGDTISQINIYNKDKNSLKRWEYEINQILPALHTQAYPAVNSITEDEIFDCDLFIFSASVGVPPIGQENKDVRMIQFEGNARILRHYAKLAREKSFQGIFAVVSDPVDLLCKEAFLQSNANDEGQLDFQGLAADQIRGYGLGVMHARAAYYAQKDPKTHHYVTEGRAFGPHGEGLIIADSIEHYNDELSIYLTEKTKKANLDVRATGFKPYIAPALSSGTLSIMATITGSWHYSATFMGGVFVGSKNRFTPTGTEIERLILPDLLFDRIKNTFERLESIL